MSTRGLPGDFQFCPYCGNATIESTSVRTYCFTCGEDVVTAGMIEALQDEVKLLTEIAILKDTVSQLTEENTAWQQAIAQYAPAVQP